MRARRAFMTLTVLLMFGCGQDANVQASQTATTKPYQQTVYVADPDPGVRCYIVVDGAPSTVAMSCLRMP